MTAKKAPSQEQNQIIAMLYRKLGENESALAHHNTAMHMQAQEIERLRQSPDIHQHLIAMRTRARWAVHFEEWKIAEEHFQEMLSTALEKEMPDISSLVWTLLAGLYLEMGDREEDYQQLCVDAMAALGDTEHPRYIQRIRPNQLPRPTGTVR